MRKQAKRIAMAVLVVWMATQQSYVAMASGEETGQMETRNETVQAEEKMGDTVEVDTASTYTVKEAYVNPLYRGILTESDLKTEFGKKANEGIAVLEEREYAETIEEAGNEIRQGMKQRKEIIQVFYKAAEYEDGLMKEIAASALIHTGIPDEGDYLMWQYGGWTAEGEIRQVQEEGVCYMTFTYTYSYYTTREQEEDVDTKLGEVLNELQVYDKPDSDKLSAVYDYICRNTEYDYENLGNGDDKLQYTAYGALINGKAVCQGYATLLYRMALELGVDCRVIPGTGNGGAHGWNIAYADGLYYNLDATWDAGSSEYDYFMKGENNFTDHIRDDEYDTEGFHESYPMSDEDYKTAELPVITSVYSRVQTTAKITWTPVSGADGYELFRAEQINASDSEWKLTKTVNGANTVQYTNTGLTAGTTYYYKVRAFWNDENQEKIYSEFSNINYMPAAVSFDGPYSNSDSRIRLLWIPVEGAHGYQIWRQKDDGTFGVVKTLGDRDNILTDDQGTASAYSNTGLEAGHTYIYRMRAFSILDGNKVFGAFSDDISVAVMPEKTEMTLETPREGAVSVKWKSVEGAHGYQIWRAGAESGDFSIVKSIRDGNEDSYINTGLSSGDSYDYKIRAYTETEGKVTFGDFSDVQRITVR